MMKCQAKDCETWGAIGQTLFPVEDGKFQGKVRYTYLCKKCAEKPKEPEYPF